MKTSISPQSDGASANIKKEFMKLSSHLRDDVEKVDDPKAKALFEVSAEMIDGPAKGF
jgi:hypothetical protein